MSLNEFTQDDLEAAAKAYDDAEQKWKNAHQAEQTAREAMNEAAAALRRIMKAMQKGSD